MGCRGEGGLRLEGPDISGNQEQATLWESLKIKPFAYFCPKMQVCLKVNISPVGNIMLCSLGT